MLISRLVAVLFVLFVAGFVGISTLLRDPAATATRLPADLDVKNVEMISEPFDALAAVYEDFDLDTARTATHTLIEDQATAILDEHLDFDIPAARLSAMLRQEITAQVTDQDIQDFNNLIAVEEDEEEAAPANVLAVTEGERRTINFGDAVGEKAISVITALQADKGALATALAAAEQEPLDAIIRPRLTRVQRVAYRDIPLETLAPETSVSGSTSANRRADVRARTGSTVAEILVDRGDRVTAGQTLLVLDIDDRNARRLQAVASIAQAEAGMAQAEANVIAAQAAISSADAQITQAQTSLSDAEASLSDVLDLGEFASTTNQRNARSAVEQAGQALSVAQSGKAQADASLSQAEAGLAQAKASLESAKASLVQIDLDIDRLTITAPFGGLIEQKFVELGGSVNAGEPVFRLADLDTILVSAKVSDSVRANLSLGQSADIVIGDGNAQVRREGVITFIDSASDAATRTFEVQLELSNQTNGSGQLEIVDNQFATVVFKGEEQALYRIPQSALTSSSIGLEANGTTGLLTLNEENRVIFTPITYADYNDGGELLILGDRIEGDSLKLIVGRSGFVKPGNLVDGRAVLDQE